MSARTATTHSRREADGSIKEAPDRPVHTGASGGLCQQNLRRLKSDERSRPALSNRARNPCGTFTSCAGGRATQGRIDRLPKLRRRPAERSAPPSNGARRERSLWPGGHAVREGHEHLGTAAVRRESCNERSRRRSKNGSLLASATSRVACYRRPGRDTRSRGPFAKRSSDRLGNGTRRGCPSTRHAPVRARSRGARPWCRACGHACEMRGRRRGCTPSRQGKAVPLAKRDRRSRFPPIFPHAGSGTGRSPDFPPRPMTTSGHT